MNLQELVQKRHDISCSIVKALQDDVVSIKLAAENMIECATNIKGHGYFMFISARESFLERIDCLQNQLEECMNINKCTH